MREITESEFKALEGLSPMRAVESAYESCGGVEGLWTRSVSASLLLNGGTRSFQSYWRLEVIDNKFKVSIYDMLVDLRESKDNQFYNLNILAKSTDNTVAVGVNSLILSPPDEVCEDWLSEIAWKNGNPVYLSNLAISLQFSTTLYYTGLLVKKNQNDYRLLEHKKLPTLEYEDDPTRTYIGIVTHPDPTPGNQPDLMGKMIAKHPEGYVIPEQLSEVMDAILTVPKPKSKKPRKKRVKQNHKRK